MLHWSLGEMFKGEGTTRVLPDQGRELLDGDSRHLKAAPALSL